MKYFNNCTTVAEVKSLFKTLAKENHPDLGGSTEIMQEINTEYAFAIAKLLKGENLTTEEINSAVNLSEKYREAVEKIAALHGIIIELVGNWIWVSGETRAVKDTLKSAGFMWASKKEMWYFRTEEFKVKNRAKLSIDQIRAKYGSERIEGRKFAAIAD